MARIKTMGTARKSTGGQAPKKRLGSPPVRKSSGKRPRVNDSSHRSEMAPSPGAKALVVANLEQCSVTDLRAGLSHHFVTVGSYATALVDRYESTIETLIKERDDSISKHNQALKERDLALTELNNFAADVKEAQQDLELGKKVWKAERVALAERLSTVKEELKQNEKKHSKEKENAYCAGYLDGWFKEHHAYIIALPSLNEAKEVTLLDHEPLEATSPLSHTRALISRFGSADP